MTPTQLRSYAAVVRHGSVRDAAAELGVSEAAVSGNVGALRKELDDRLFQATGQGLAFTPGGLRLATRAVELLGLQERTRREVGAAGAGQRVLRVAATSLFAEYAAPGLIELFTTRADDLDVELMVESSARFPELLHSHAVDLAIGPRSSRKEPTLDVVEFLRYDLVAVSSPEIATGSGLKTADWLLGPSAVEAAGVSQFILQRARIEEDRQRIYPSHASAVEEARNGKGVALAPSFAVTEALTAGRLVRVDPTWEASGVWSVTSLGAVHSSPAARELVRFVSTPRAIQAMLSGSGSNIARFKPQVHITLWS